MFNLYQKFLYGEYGRNFRMSMMLFYIVEPMYMIYFFWIERSAGHSLGWSLGRALLDFKSARGLCRSCKNEPHTRRLKRHKSEP